LAVGLSGVVSEQEETYSVNHVYKALTSALQGHILHPFNGLFSRTAWLSQHQKGRAILDFNEAGDDGWHASHLHFAPDR